MSKFFLDDPVDLKKNRGPKVKGGLSSKENMTVPGVFLLPEGGNYQDSIVTLEFLHADQMLVKKDKVWVELTEEVVEDLVAKLKFILKTKRNISKESQK